MLIPQHTMATYWSFGDEDWINVESIGWIPSTEVYGYGSQ